MNTGIDALKILRVSYHELLTTIEQAIQKNKVPHAWLFSGPKGVGKRTLSLNIAYLLLGKFACFKDAQDTLNRNHPLVRQIDQKSHPEFMQLPVKASIDEVRQLKQRLGQTSFFPSWRIAIIPEANSLSSYSINALLKLIETPPPNTLFMLTSSGPVVKTIFSRCVHYSMSSMSFDKFNENIPSDCPKDPLFTLLCHGCIGRAHRIKSIFPIAKQWWDFFFACCHGPCIIPKALLEEIIENIVLFEEVLLLWCHYQYKTAYLNQYLLQLDNFLLYSQQALNNYKIFHTDAAFVVNGICAKITMLFSVK